MARASLARRCLAEAFATFALVFAGCGAIVVDSERDGSLGAVGIAAAFGLVIFVMVYALAHVSGAHINPAVSIACAATQRFPPRDALAYVPAQLAGAVAGAAFLRLAWNGTPAQLGATTPSAGISAALAYELVLTGLLMFVIVSLAMDTRTAGAAGATAIGGTVALGSLVGGDVSGGSMNPARSFGPGPRRVGVDAVLDLRRRPSHRGAGGRAAVRSPSRRRATSTAVAFGGA